MASGHYGELQNKFICPRFHSHKDYVVVVVNVELKLIHLPFKYYNRLITFSSIEKKSKTYYYRLNDWQIIIIIIITLITEEWVPFYKIIIRNFGYFSAFFFIYKIWIDPCLNECECESRILACNDVYLSCLLLLNNPNKKLILLLKDMFSGENFTSILSTIAHLVFWWIFFLIC